VRRHKFTGVLRIGRRRKPIADADGVETVGVNQRLTATEHLALLGLVGAAIAGFLWASTFTLRNAFFNFFSAPPFAFPVSHEDMLYQGALDQLFNLLSVSVAVWFVWLLWSEFDHPAHPRLMSARNGVVSIVKFFAPLIWVGGLWVILYALQEADSKGLERARKFALSAERGMEATTLIRRKVDEEIIVVEGFGLGCSEKFCALYLPGPKKTQPTAKTAAGTTVLVPLDSLLSMTIVSGRSTLGSSK
jgi:hypothetical protein